MRNPVFAHGNFHLHPRVIYLPQHFDHPPHGLSKQSRRLGQFHHHDLSRRSSPRSTLGNQHVLAVPFVLRGDQPDTALLKKAPDDGLGRALQNLDHAAFRPAAPVLARDAHAHPVLVQYRPHLIGRKVDVRLAVIAQDEAMPVAVSLDGAFDLVQ